MGEEVDQATPDSDRTISRITLDSLKTHGEDFRRNLQKETPDIPGRVIILLIKVLPV
jgi:hypothetical protein